MLSQKRSCFISASEARPPCFLSILQVAMIPWRAHPLTVSRASHSLYFSEIEPLLGYNVLIFKECSGVQPLNSIVPQAPLFKTDFVVALEIGAM